jgi:hypothetical protein
LGAARKVGAPGLDGVLAGLVSSSYHCQLWLAWAACADDVHARS